MCPMENARERVLVTGASAGIGVELARLFAADGSDLVLVARREDRLRALADELATTHGIEARVVPQDLSQPGSAAALVERLSSDGIQIDVVVNNAGFGATGSFAELELERQLAMIRLNVVTLTELTHRLLPAIRERGRGGILNVASTAGFQPGPSMAVYYATKAFVLHFTEAVREELLGTGISITALCPGPTWTEFMEVAGLGHPPLFNLFAMKADRAARAGHRAFRKGKPVAVPGIGNKLGTMLVRLTPRRLVPKAVRRVISER